MSRLPGQMTGLDTRLHDLRLQRAALEFQLALACAALDALTFIAGADAASIR